MGQSSSVKDRSRSEPCQNVKANSTSPETCGHPVINTMPKNQIKTLFPLTNDELGNIAEISRPVAGRPHSRQHRFFRFLLSLGRKLRGGDPSEHLPSGGEVVKIKAESLGFHARIEARILQLLHKLGWVRQRSGTHAGNRWRRGETTSNLLKADYVAQLRSCPRGSHETPAGA